MKPLGNTERKIILAAELYTRRRGASPTWIELGRAVGLYESRADRATLGGVMNGLRKKGLVTFEDGVARSLQVHPHAVKRAMER